MQDRSEKLIINSVMTDPECLHDVMSKINASMFKSDSNRKVFALISSPMR